jgi:hypothetical protein
MGLCQGWIGGIMNNGICAMGMLPTPRGWSGLLSSSQRDSVEKHDVGSRIGKCRG